MVRHFHRNNDPYNCSVVGMGTIHTNHFSRLGKRPSRFSSSDIAFSVNLARISFSRIRHSFFDQVCPGFYTNPHQKSNGHRECGRLTFHILCDILLLIRVGTNSSYKCKEDAIRTPCYGWYTNVSNRPSNSFARFLLVSSLLTVFHQPLGVTRLGQAVHWPRAISQADSQSTRPTDRIDPYDAPTGPYHPGWLVCHRQPT